MDEFLTVLFGDAIAGDRQLCVFTLPSKHARHFATIADAVAYAGGLHASQDVYFGVGLAGSRFGQRNTASDITAIVGLWADIDIAAPWRNGKPLPPTREDAMAILDKLPFAPSVLVDSGHGLHAYWLFREPWIFESASEHSLAARTAKGWVDAIRHAAGSLGWSADAVGDLARVLRLPGTRNRKSDPPAAVRVLEYTDRRYNPYDFEEFAVDDDVSRHAGSNGSVPHAGDMPQAKFSALYEASPTFAATWRRERDDMQDQSGSSYDMSLATIAAFNGWDDGEIASLIYAARIKHGDKPEKALRPSYIGPTIATARCAAESRADPGDVDLSAFTAKKPEKPDGLRIYSLGELVDEHPAMLPPTIHGIAREGETVNVIASSKAGKSWLIYSLAYAVATGTDWLGFPCEQGRVLLIDNELHRQTLASRLRTVAEAKGVDIDGDARRLIDIIPVRGRLVDLNGLGRTIQKIQAGEYRVVIADAFYRFLPAGVDENSNSSIAMLYNTLDNYAEHLKSTWVNIHHSSKGSQADKSVTDVGAGAGSQARAADAHVVLREHEEEGAVVLSAAVRSFPPVPSVVLRWDFPVWHVDHAADPERLKRPGRQESKPKESTLAADMVRIEAIVSESPEPITKTKLRSIAQAHSITRGRFDAAFEVMEEEGIVESFDSLGWRGKHITAWRVNPIQ